MERSDERPAAQSQSPSSARGLVWIVGALTALVGGSICAAVIGLRAANDGPEPEGRNWWLVAWLLTGVAYSLAGVLLLTRQGRRLLGAGLLTVGVSSLVDALAVQYRWYERSIVGPPRWPVLAHADAWARPMGAAMLIAFVPGALVAAETRPGRRALVLRLAALAATGTVAVASAAGWNRIDLVVSWIVGLIGLHWIVVLGQRWWRQRRTTTDALVGWLCVGGAVAWLAVVPDGLDLADWSLVGHDVVWALLLTATVPLLVVGALIEELRRVPSDAEQLSHRGLEWALFAAGIIVIYTVIVAGLGRLVGGSGPTWLLVAATGAIALGIEPARRRIRQHVDRLVFGSRDDALAVVQQVVDHVGTDTGDDLLPALVRSLERGLRFDMIAIDLAAPGGTWERAASSGLQTEHHHEVTLRHRDELVGRLVVGWSDAPAMRFREQQLVDQLVGPLSLAVSWVRLASDLRRSSLAVVSAREEERRRLRRDLHDGVGPTLTGVSLGLRTAVRQLDRATDGGSSQSSSTLLTRLAEEVDGVVHEIKQIVRDLRPTVLDQLGLTGAIAEFTRRFADDLDIQLSLPPAATPLPAAVEVAAYRIVTEALTNVIRHAHAEQCWVRIATDDRVDIDVIDNGVGIDTRRPDGVGLTAMRERAAELGGAVWFVTGRATGTHLHVQLPATLP